MTAAAERHRRYAARFAEVVAGVTDWDAPTPVKEWAARDVVAHLIDWFPGFLEAGTGIALPATGSVAADPAGAWDDRRADVQDDTLDESVCAEMLAGMEQMTEVIRSSGQFGDQQDAPVEASAQRRFIAFIGRDPLWRPESA